MKIYDVSQKIQTGMTVWPDDPRVEIVQFASIQSGQGYNATRFSMSAHTGTHVDAPYHFIEDGRKIDQLNLEDLCGPVQVVHVPSNIDAIDSEVIKSASIEPLTERVVFRTSNSDLRRTDAGTFDKNYVGLTTDAAKLLVEMKLRLVGTDYLSVAGWDHLRAVHEILLAAGVVLLEGLDLSQVSAGRYSLFCLPMNLVGSDGAPARTVLVEG